MRTAFCFSFQEKSHIVEVDYLVDQIVLRL